MKELKNIINNSINSISVDGNKINKFDEIIFGEEILIELSEGHSLSIITDDIPHFFGEGELIINHSKSSEQLNNDIDGEKRITKILLFYWSPKLVLFNKKKYLAHIEFYNQSKLILSLGFFYLNYSTNQFEYLITGELSTSFIGLISLKGYKESLFIKEISDSHRPPQIDI